MNGVEIRSMVARNTNVSYVGDRALF